MDQERWQRIEALFHAALERRQEAREAFLEASCSADTDLRWQVELLLAKGKEAGAFLEIPAMHYMALAQTAAAVLLGRQFGPYQIVSALGAGGMGEVYRAHDSKLGRDVAIKILPAEFAREDERLARLRREARTLASLNHPGIGAIYGLEQSEEVDFLVLELVEGETLADQLKRGPIPVEEALKLALQIADALEAAHDKGVIHRDLKPANIKVTPEGKVKVLDFGLAKTFAAEQVDLNPANSPMLSPAASQQGVILGTAAYMSPEQARGKIVDKRADIWAFGCVLFEMLTGHAAFSGNDVTDILAAVIRAEPDWSDLPANLHGRLREVIERCLKKDTGDRFHDIADVRSDIQRIWADPGDVSVQSVATGESRKKTKLGLSWVAAAVVLSGFLAGVAVWKFKPSEPRQVIRLEYELPADQQFSNLNMPVLAVSPNGKQFVYSTTKGLYLRSADELAAKLIAGTEGSPQQPFFSPDGKWVGYWSEEEVQLKKIAISGGAPVAVCRVNQTMIGATWGADNAIVYGLYSGSLSSGDIMRISANGGTPESLVKAQSPIGIPQILPDGMSVLFTFCLAPNRIVAQTFKSGTPKELLTGSTARYLPTGHIVYAVENNLFAVPFDPNRIEVIGEPTPVVEGVYGNCGYAVSDSGTLVYIPGITGAAARGRTLVWVDRTGKEEPISAPPNAYNFPKISPDGTRVALTITTGGNQDIWIWDLIRKTISRLTFEKASIASIWTPDGKHIVFASMHDGHWTVYWKAADGAGTTEQLLSVPGRNPFPSSISGDGKFLVMTEEATAAKWEIAMLSMEGARIRKPLLHETYDEVQPKISPDGRYLAYASNESGRVEVYVSPFPDVDKGKWQVSTSGGSSPLWSPNGRELFYLSYESSVMVSAVETKPDFSVGTPKPLFRHACIGAGPSGTPWDISPDGKHFLMMKEGSDVAGVGGPRKINVVLNWFEELKKRVPVQ